MKLSQIEYFVLVADELSFSSAAEKSFVSRQAISKALHELESELDVKLFRFDRNNHLLLTPAGSELLPDFRHLLEYTESIKRKARRINEKGRKLRVAYSDILLFFMIPDVINMLRAMHTDSSGLISEITAISNVELASGKTGDEYDFILFLTKHGHMPSIHGYSGEILKSYPGGIALPHTSDLLMKETLSPEDLRGHRIIVPVSGEIMDMDDYFSKYEIEYSPVGSFYSATYQSISNSDCIIDIILSIYDKNFVHRELEGLSFGWDVVLMYRSEPGSVNIRKIKNAICKMTGHR